MPTTIIDDFSLEPKAEPAPPERAAAARNDKAKSSPDAVRELERVLRRNRHRELRLWAY